MKRWFVKKNTTKNAISRVMSSALCVTLLVTAVMPVSAFVPPTDPGVSLSLRNGFSNNPDKYEIYPVPQELTYLEGEHFTLGNEVNLVFEQGIDEYTERFLKEVLGKYNLRITTSNQIHTKKTNILVGIAGSDGIVDNYTKGQGKTMAAETTTSSAIEATEEEEKAFITTNSAITMSAGVGLFDEIDSYILNAQEGIITILGKDTDSAFHGVATLQMMFSSFAGQYFLPVHIEDWAEMEYRGIVEGFYGAWDFAGRESLMRSSRDIKMNNFVYAAKGDEYHRSKWAVPYPDKDIRQIAETVKVGKETKVEFVWAVHLEHFFRGMKSIAEDHDEYAKRLGQLTAKFDQLYDVGVRRFDVLNDDFGSGSDEDVVRLLNDLMTDYVDKKDGVEPIVFCPQGYNISWSGNGKELEAISKADPRIKVFWTGHDVNSPITQESVSFLKGKTGLDPVFWINFPVNEHAKSGIYLGEISHYARDGVTGLGGAVSNPSWFTETNKVGLFQLGSLFWNNQNYSSYAVELWEDSFKYLEPEVYESYLTIGRNVANAPNSTRVPGFPESEYIKNQLETVLAHATAGKPIAEKPETQELLTEFNNILWAVEDFRTNGKNETLKEELEPWLKSLKDIATAGKGSLEAAVALEKGDIDTAWVGLFAASNGLSTWDVNGIFPNEATVFAKAGTKRLHPFAQKLTAYVTKELTPLLNPGSSEVTSSFYGVMGGQVIVDSDNTAKIFDRNPNTYAAFKTVQKKDDYFGVDFGRAISVEKIQILQGENDTHHDYFHQATLEYSVDGTTWNTLVPQIDSRRIELSGLDFRARYVRLRLLETGTADKADYWTFIRKFAVNDEETPFKVFTNADKLRDSTVRQEGMDYTLTTRSDQITLPAKGYVGISLPEIVGATSIAVSPKLAQGLVLEYSVNKAKWESASGLTNNTALRYVRIRNNSDAPITFDFNELSVSLDSVEISPEMIETNLKNDLKEGKWENLFDGKHNTFAWTNEAQVEGQYMIFDLGVSKPIHDVTLLTDEVKPRLYNGMLSISNNKSDWETIVEVIDSHVNGEGTVDPPHRRIKANGNGNIGRYIKLEITKTEQDSPYLKLYELEINKTVQDEEKITAFSGKPVGSFERAIDNDLSTIFTPGLIEIEDGYFEYILSDNVNVESVNVLQDPNSISNAVVKVQSLDGKWVTLGALDQSASIFDTSGLDSVQKLRLEWVKGTRPAIAEIFFSTEAEEEEEVEENETPIVYPNIVKVPSVEDVTVNNGTPWAMVGLPEYVSVTLSNDRAALLQVDWSSSDYDPLIKGDYDATGRFRLPENITNPAQITLGANVTVKAALGETKEGNLALNQPVTVSGHEGGDNRAEEMVDGNLDTRWSANKMKDKDDMDANKQIPGANWAIIDLGEGNNTIKDVNITYHAKASGTKYEIQVSDDQGDDSWVKIGEVDKAANDEQNATHKIPVNLNGKGRYVRVYFKELNVNAKAATGVSIKEIEVNGTKTYGATSEPENLALEKTTYVSGTETPTSVGAKAVDGDMGSKWDSNYMKKSQNQPTENLQDPAWIVVDLGEDVDKISSVSAAYFNLVYPTKYTIELSDTNDEDAIWKNIKTFDKPHKGPGNPLDEVVFDQPITGKRYIRLHMTQMNVGAAGHAVGLKELTVTGTRKVDVDPNVVKINPQKATGILGIDFADLILPTRAVAQLADESNLSLPVTWDSQEYDAAAKEQTLTGTVALPEGILNTDDIKAILHLTLEGKPQITSITNKEITVAFGTDFSELKLPKQVVGHLDNGYSEVMDVTWLQGDYNPQLEGNHILKGSITVPEGVKNEEMIQAKLTITVLPAIVETTDLEVEIQIVEEKIESGKIVEADYTIESWDALEVALKDAKELLEGKPSQVDVTNALVNLTNAFSNLEREEEEEIIPPVDEDDKEEVIPPVVDEDDEEVIPPVVDEDDKEEIIPPAVDEGGGGSGSQKPKPETPQVQKPGKPTITIDKDGTKLELGKIDKTKPTVVIDVKPDKEGVVCAKIPMDILTDAGGENTDLVFEINAGYGSYQIPVNLASLVPNLGKIMQENNIKSEDIDFAITITDRSKDTELQKSVKDGLPNGTIMGAMLDFSIDIINRKTEKSVGKADSFTKDITRVIAMPEDMKVMPETWGAFRHNDTTKSLEFVPAKATKIDGVWYVAISSNSNSTYLVVDNNIEFKDVMANHWGRVTIKNAAAKGLVGGVGKGLYEPNRLVTRAEFVEMIARAMKLPIVQKDTKVHLDVAKDAWYYNTIVQARSAGLLTHFSEDDFMPNNPITREEMASVLAGALRYKKVAITKDHVDLETIFTDYDQIDSSLQNDIETIYKLKIMQGMSATTFEAGGIATRAQAAVVQMNLLRALGLIE